MHLIGIDLGGTKTEGIVMTRQGETVTRQRVATPSHDGYDAIVAMIRRLVVDLEAAAKTRCTVGVCTPGSISHHTGLLKNSNTNCLNNRDIKKDIETALGRSIRIENDANCFTLSEAMDGAATDYDPVFGVILGTGVGGGIVVGKKLLRGRHHIAGEWGHNVLESDGPECYCGKRGCVEVFLSGPALIRDWTDVYTRPTSVQDLFEKAQRRDTAALATVEQFFQRFGKALSVVVNVLDPGAIVLGGGVSNIQELYSRGAKAVAGHVFNDTFTTPILQNRHGDSSGVRGAAQLWATALP